MKRISISIVLALFASVGVTSKVLAQNYDLSWYTIDGGGGSSTGGAYSLSGTIGQPDAQTPPVMTGGGFTLTGGFWAGFGDVCTLLGDMNHDGLIDGQDVQLFTNCVITGSGDCGCADMNGGGVSQADVAPFVSALLGT